MADELNPFPVTPPPIIAEDNDDMAEATKDLINKQIDDAFMSLSNELPIFTDEFGNPIQTKLTDNAKTEYDTLLKLLQDLMLLTGDGEYSADELVEMVEILTKIDAIENAIKNNDSRYVTTDDDELNTMNENNRYTLSSWDPRLQRVDYFFLKGSENNAAPTIIPFSSLTAASSFLDLVFTERKAIVDAINAKVPRSENTKATPSDPNSNNASTNTPKNYAALSEKSYSANDYVYNLGDENLGEKLLDETTYVPMDEESYLADSRFYGAASLMNPYSITKLVGGLGAVDSSGNFTFVGNNFLYDIRDLRRFYGYNIENNDVLAVSSPTLRNIIAFANADKWGRTPYQYQDFLYCKWYGIIPTNRLITLRRYHAPTYDNLQFEGMEVDNGIEPRIYTPHRKGAKREPTKAFAPRCTLVTYCGEDTGNTFSDILKFTTGINWDEAESKIWNVDGQQGEDAQTTIDRMFDNGGFSGSDNAGLNKVISMGNLGVLKILSFGKFAGALTLDYGMDLKAFENTSKVNQDPYNDGIYANRIQGPLNRIDKVKKRKEGIIFELSFTLKFSYKAKSLGGINPKAAMLDILGNCLEMVSADALFWGGGHRFMIEPKLYPYHDHGWRDSFMKKLYDGKIFGEGGAMDYVLKGVKNFASKDKDGKETGDMWGNILSRLGQFLGEGLGAIGNLISGAASALFGEGAGNFVKDLAGKAGIDTESQGATDKAAKAKEMGKKLFGNLNNMWHNKVMAETVVPNIKGMNSLLIGEPVGEWHLTVGNPLNPIIVVGNLICEKMDVEFSDELGPDDFPEEMHVTYTLQHGMARDKAAIQSMFNRGMGKFYELPDYIKSASDLETRVDHYTGKTGFRQPAFESGPGMLSRQMRQNGYKGVSTYQNYKVDSGSEASNNGSNANTSFTTKFTPPNPAMAADIVGSGQVNPIAFNLGAPVIRSLGINRKYNN